MKLDFRIYLFIISLLNTFLTIISQKVTEELEKAFSPPKDNNSYCLKLILYNNHTLYRKYVLNDNFAKLFSIASFDKIILYDCLDDSNEYCSYRNFINSTISKDYITNKKSYNNDFFNCFITEYYENLTNHGCIQIEKKEYERFRWYKDPRQINETRTWDLECYANLYFIGKFKFIRIFIILYFFLF